MPFIAGRKMSTPLTREFVRWLTVTVGRSPLTVSAYRDQVEFFVGQLAAADTFNAIQVVAHKMTPHADRWSSAVDPVWADVPLRACEAFCSGTVAEGTSEPSTSTRRKRVHALRIFFEFLVDHEEIVRTPAGRLRAPGVTPSKPKPIGDVDWLLLWDQEMTPEDRVMLGLGYYLGLRRHEIIGVGPQHFDLELRRVAGFKRKGAKQNDVLYGRILDDHRRLLPNLAVRTDEFELHLRWLVDHRQKALDERLLPMTEHVDLDHSDSTLNRRMLVLGRSCSRPITPHMMRHSFGTNLMRMGYPPIVIADQMNHSNLDTTRGYLDTNQWFDMMLNHNQGGQAP